MKMKKTEAALEAAKTAKQNIAKKLEAEKGEGVRSATLLGSSLMIGGLEAGGRLASIPTGPMPKTLVFVIPKLVGLMLKDGIGKQVSNGVGDAGIAITGYNFMRGARMSGARAGATPELAAEADEIERMERHLERRRAGGPGRRRGRADDLETELAGSDD